MNIIEAIQSGKPFKRPMHIEWHTIQTVDDGISNFGSVAITAEDWEIQHKQSFSRDDLMKILNFYKKHVWSYNSQNDANTVLDKTLEFADNL